MDEAEIERVMLELVAARGPASSICPSEVARALADEAAWRGLMGVVRRVAVRLAQAGRIEILRKGKAVSGEAVRGVIRLRAVA